MSAPDPKWARWIFASFSNHFYHNRQSIPFFVEGEERGTEQLEDYIEFRMNGPMMKECSKDYWLFEVVVNILVVHKMNDQSIHTLHDLVGKISAAFFSCISIWKYGEGNDLNPDFLGVMRLIERDKQKIQINHIGKINPDVNELQSMVEGYYRMELEV